MMQIRHRWLRRLSAATWAVYGMTVLAAPAAANGEDFGKWLQELRRQALDEGITAATLDAALIGVQPIQRVIELDRDQPEFKLSFLQYLDLVAPESRVASGREALARNRALLEAVGARYGVQPRFIVALWGVETDFGRATGGFPIVAALATLAHEGRRSEFFRRELLDALHILDERHIGVAAMTGSWAGAMGQSQFMPSSFRRFAVDYDGDGRRDIWTTEADVFASIANYLASHGWRAGQNWGRAARLPPGFDPALVGAKVEKPLAEWQALGVRTATGGDLPAADLAASVVQPDGPRGPAFIVYENFKTILRWNRSTYFAAAVGYLADRIGGG